jgi:hypothetical protein
MTEIALQYEPREQFIPFHQRSNRWGALLCHRRAGKTVACVNDLVVRALYTKKTKARYAYIGPFRQQAKEIAWEYLKEATAGMRKGDPRESDLRVQLHNDAVIQIYGADNPNSLRGLYFDGVILDEYADCKPSIWGEIILPALTDRRGWACFVGTIKGKNHFYKLTEKARKDNDWFFMELKGSQSGILSERDILDLKAQMTEAQYEQEIECNPNAAVQGTYYSDIIQKMEVEGRVSDFPYNPHELVHVSADLGFTDSTAFWFWQLDKDGPILIDYFEDDGKSLDHYFAMLNEKGYEYADIWLPHDAVARTLSTGRSTVEQFIDNGFPCKVVPRLAVQHGIDAARLMLPSCRIDKTLCAEGIEALRAYRRSWNDKAQQYSNTPLHDWASNGADAFRYFSLVTDETKAKELAVNEAVNQLKAPQYTLDELFAANETSDWRESILRIG